MEITRRNFLKIGAVAGGAAAISTQSVKKVIAMGKKIPSGPAKYIPTVCEMCYWRCGVMAKVVNGVVVNLEGNPAHPNSRGKLCARGHGGLGLIYDPDRLKQPMIRIGKRGEGKFEKVSWDKALDYIAEKLLNIKEKYGPESLALFAHGSVTTYFLHLLKAFGSPNVAMPSFSFCAGAREVAFKLTYGDVVGNPERADIKNAKVIVLIGFHIGENAHNSMCQEFAEAIGRGATLIVVDPRFSSAAGKAKYWLPIKPGTDIALLLAWMHVLIYEGLYDKPYVEKFTYGFEELKAHVKEYTPEWAEKETEIPARIIRETAYEMARYKPSVLIHPGRHTAWYKDNTQRERCIAILTALLGAYGRPGGMYLPPKNPFKPYKLSPKKYPKHDKPALNRGPYPLASPKKGVIPELIKATLKQEPYPIKAWFITGTNLIKSAPRQPDTIEAMTKKLDLLVVVDVLPFDHVMYADVVLPECTYLERYDDFFIVKERFTGVALRQPVVKPMYDTRPGWWIAKELAKRLGLGDYFPWEDLEDYLKAKAAFWGIDFNELKEKGFIGFPETAQPYISLTNPPKFKTPTKKIELYSTKLEKLGFDPLPRYEAPESPPEGWFRLIYGRAPVHTFGRTTNNELLCDLMPENVLWVNAKVAKKLGLKQGEYVVLQNQDGVKSNKIKVKITERIRKDCVYMPHGFGSFSPMVRRAYMKGADDQQLITRYAMDPICGSTGFRVNFVKILKEG